MLKNGRDELGRIHRDIAFMEMCFIISKLSIDNSSKCGCIATHKDGAILSAGYNNPIRGSNDAKVPINIRPDKYYFMEHSERNAIYNAARHGIPLYDCIFYVSGFPCMDCMRGMVQSGASRIVYGPNHQANTYNSYDIYLQVLEGQRVTVERFKYDEELYAELPYIKEIVNKKINNGIEDIRFEHNV